MQDFLKWTLKSIREDTSPMSWMEEKRFEWTPLIASSLKALLKGTSFIIITDRERDWFGEYLVTFLNKSEKKRPLLPFFLFKSLCSNYNKTSLKKEDIDIINDLFSISFMNGYRYFYIGRSSDSKLSLAKSRDDSLIWVMDEQLQNSFYLNSKDELLDIKLIQLARLFDKSIDLALFSQQTLQLEGILNN